MTKLVHHSKAPSHCLLHMKIIILLHDFPPLHSHLVIVQKKCQYTERYTKGKNIKKKMMTTPHLEMQQRSTRYWERQVCRDVSIDHRQKSEKPLIHSILLQCTALREHDWKINGSFDEPSQIIHKPTRLSSMQSAVIDFQSFQLFGP